MLLGHPGRRSRRRHLELVGAAVRDLGLACYVVHAHRDEDGDATAGYRIYTFCSQDPAPPCDVMKGNEIIDGGRLTLRITKVITAHHTSTATATVLTSTDPKLPVGSSQVLTLNGDVIDSPIGTLCDDKAAAKGVCGA